MIIHREITVKSDQDLFIIGDLHGCYNLYEKGKAKLGIRDTDVVVSLGDLTDRGKQNFRCVLEFTRKHNRYAIRGNHEDMMIKGMLEGDRSYYECWYQNGGYTVFEECGEEGATALAMMTEDLPVVLIVNYRGMKLAFIHGGYPSSLEYLPVTDIPEYISKHGHSYVKTPIINANRVYMDTGSVFNNNLTFAYFDMDGGLQFYSTLEED